MNRTLGFAFLVGAVLVAHQLEKQAKRIDEAEDRATRAIQQAGDDAHEIDALKGDVDDLERKLNDLEAKISDLEDSVP
jgi:polyhydroxyalkanoate synthesis regulator phasin